MKKVLPFILAAFCGYQVNAQADLSKGLIAYYPFNGNAKDASGLGHHGTVTGATLTADQKGRPSSAYYFAGGSSYIVIPNTPDLSPVGKFSVCAKVNMQGFYDDFCYNNVILAKGLDRSYGSYSLRTTTAGLDCYTQDTNIHVYRCDVQNISVSTADLDTKPYVKTFNWDCLVGTYENDTVKMYVNGVLRYQYYEPGKGTNTDDIYIGMLNPADRSFWFKGVIDEVRIYNRALSKDEVNLYCEIGQTSAIAEQNDEVSFAIYPNPVADKMQLNCTAYTSSAVTVSVTDLLGRVYTTKHFDKAPFTTEMDLGALAPGTYLVVLNSDGARTVQRFIRK